MLYDSDELPVFPHNKNFLYDQLDPSIELEYNKLVNAWTQQLLNEPPTPHLANSSLKPSTDPQSTRYLWLRLIHRYLDQQWIDSQQMLQCAQAWNTYPTLNPVEAVHTMNILSLRTMQRSIDARREFLDIFGGKKDILVESFSLPTPTPDTHSAIPTPGSPNSRVSFALSEEEMHAPLLRTQQLGSNQVSDSIMSIADYDPTDLDPYSPSISNNTYWNYPRAASVLSEEKTQVEANTRNPEGAREPLYKHLSTWKKLVGNSSETVEAKPWCSWHEQGLLSSSEIHMKDPHSHHLYSSSTNTIALDDVPIATPAVHLSHFSH